jgi:hypothetical protein
MSRRGYRGLAGNVPSGRDLGLVIGAGGGSLTLFEGVRSHGGAQPTTARAAATLVCPRRRAYKHVLQNLAVDKTDIPRWRRSRGWG